MDTSGRPSDTQGPQGKKAAPAAASGDGASAPPAGERKAGVTEPQKGGSDGQKGKVAVVRSQTWGRSKSVGGGAVAPPADAKAPKQNDSKPQVKAPPQQQTTTTGRVVEKSGVGARKKDAKEIQEAEKKKIEKEKVARKALANAEKKTTEDLGI